MASTDDSFDLPCHPSQSHQQKYPAKRHAERVVERLGIKHGLIYLQGTVSELWRDSDQDMPFRQWRYFYYLSGVNEPDCHITYNVSEKKLILWIPPIDTTRNVFYNGLGLTPEAALQKYDVDDVEPIHNLSGYIRCWECVTRSRHGEKNWPARTVYTGRTKPREIPCRQPTQWWEARTEPAFVDASVETFKLTEAIDACRGIKDDYEIAMIRKANDISALAHKSILRQIRSFRSEKQVEAQFIGTCIANSATSAYDVIAGSGSNAATLHYTANNARFGDSQFMVLDAGAEYNCYAADVTRTFPLSGAWPSDEARAIYSLVDNMLNQALGIIAPGKHYLEAYLLSMRVGIKGLLELGILHNGSVDEIFAAGTLLGFFPHGLGHHLGLEVHDVSESGIAPTEDDESDRQWFDWTPGMRVKGWPSDKHPGTFTYPPPPSQFNESHLPVPKPASKKPSPALEALRLPLDVYNAHAHEPGWHRGAMKIMDQVKLMQPLTAKSPPLKPGMVVTVEPGIYFNEYVLGQAYLSDPVHGKYINKDVLKRYMSVGGVRIEDNILITESGWENLTTAPKGEEAINIIRGNES